MYSRVTSKVRSLQQRELIVFDFDETLVDCNSDSWIHQLSPNGSLPNRLEYRDGQDYFNYVQSVLDHLHHNRVSESNYYECLAKMPSVPGMIDSLVTTLAKQPDRYHMVILSDSNSFFIESYLKSKSLDKAFIAVLTNSGKFVESNSEYTGNSRLQLQEYHIQDYCKMSARNLCKGEALKNFIGKQMLDHNTVYTCVNYVGDGENDLCPCTKLSDRDIIFPRRGYPLDRLCSRIKEACEDPEDAKRLPELKAEIISWSSGNDILRVIASTEKTSLVS